MNKNLNVTALDHPLIQHKITLLRDKNTGNKEFRELVSEVTMLMCYESLRDLPLKNVEIETPVTSTTSQVLSGKEIAFVPILRAGMGMLPGAMNLVPNAKVGHIGTYRDENAMPHSYYCKLPCDIAERKVIVLDPMLATGGTVVDTIDQLKKNSCTNIKLMCIIAAPEGVKVLNDAHPDVQIYCAALDESLNDHAYIVPGLGDAGDRIYGTK